MEEAKGQQGVTDTTQRNGLSCDIRDLQCIQEYLGPGIKFIFSWIILMPIAVIISGKILRQHMRIDILGRQLFEVRIPKILRIQGRDDEVVLGFAAFIATLFSTGMVYGVHAYTYFRAQFGIDPGHFNSLCILSSFGTVVWVLVLHVILTWCRRRPVEERPATEHEQVIERLAKRGDLPERAGS